MKDYGLIVPCQLDIDLNVIDAEGKDLIEICDRVFSDIGKVSAMAAE